MEQLWSRLRMQQLIHSAIHSADYVYHNNKYSTNSRNYNIFPAFYRIYTVIPTHYIHKFVLIAYKWVLGSKTCNLATTTACFVDQKCWGAWREHLACQQKKIYQNWRIATAYTGEGDKMLIVNKRRIKYNLTSHSSPRYHAVTSCCGDSPISW